MKYILTGGTGFLGSLLGEELLRLGHEVIFLGRSRNDVLYEERQKSILLAINRDVRLEKASFLESDFHKKNLGLGEESIGTLRGSDGFFHLAADLSFLKRDKERVFMANLDSLAHITALCGLLNIPLLYTSTAYVHGVQKNGTLTKEELYEKPKRFNNFYEESKYVAEKYISEWGERSGSRFLIFRPSIIVDRENKTSTPYGIYSFIIGLLKLGRSFPIVFPYVKNARLNFVPADLVVRWMIKIGTRSDLYGKTFHLVSKNPFPIRQIVNEVFRDALGMKVISFPAPRLVVYGWIYFLHLASFIIPRLRNITERTLVYNFYLSTYVLYDTSNTVLGTGDDLKKLTKCDDGYLTLITKHFVSRYQARKARSQKS
ncbi:MAG: hypothetical protein COV07_00690 [Candidatus Vogelbacteria bacterium CG10_big_fil_rev_8_21_14_0_10_45_14]|uniref:Thioester reductase (TE) domain-containing protein n=1 Tax=Candidatus Vogelbacteria bacterium CG10_big_fil_rev_8_21_14_0_10_45_14 TaxID=1975042 RepID=A0A2H0RL78_9BACT|nr:MAG: hypothetical protein COV07_00690 [Candidatus Vogelbacteria bacterium CG10_big_fil_rev_8_21_14_0_10_45_14]